MTPNTMNNTSRPQPINSAVNDFNTPDGCRISVPVYIDLTTVQRKQLLNGVRERLMKQQAETKPPSASGISVVTNTAGATDIETYLGLTIDVLRTVIFQRGGIEISLLLRLQEVAGIEMVSQKDITSAFNSRKKLIGDYLKTYPLTQTDAVES